MRPLLETRLRQINFNARHSSNISCNTAEQLIDNLDTMGSNTKESSLMASHEMLSQSNPETFEDRIT